MNAAEIIAWLQERRDNCVRIATLKSGMDQRGWMDDAAVFEAAIDLLTAPIQEPFRAGFEAAKNAAIQCARQSEYWNLFEASGCKAVQHSIEFMQMLDASRFNHDGSMKPETYVEYDRAKHGPIVNGKVDIRRKL